MELSLCGRNVFTAEGDLPDSHFKRVMASNSAEVDIETDTRNGLGLDWKNGRIEVVTVGIPEADICVVKLDDDRLAEPPHRLMEMMRSDWVIKYFHHAMFDLRFMIRAWRIHPTMIRCTKIAAHLDDPERHLSHSLAPLIRAYLGVIIEKGHATDDWHGEMTPERLQYCAQDVMYLKSLFNTIRAELDDSDGLDQHLMETLRYLPTMAALETRGYGNPFSYK